MTIKTIIEFLSAILILVGFELFNRKSIKGFFVMAIGQFLAMIICGYAELWFLAFMHFVNFLMQIRGWMKWKKEALN
ncbi:MAG: nicotinamide mononucleotide transporter, partial [Saprospiraceae bacterium]